MFVVPRCHLIIYNKTFVYTNFRRNNSLTASQVVRDIYVKNGVHGFYKGITASYYGLSETVIHLVIYEEIKSQIRSFKGQCLDDDEERTARDFVEYMAAGGMSKMIATCVAYPHGESFPLEPHFAAQFIFYLV